VGPLLPPLGGCEGQDWQKSLDGSPSNHIRGAAVGGRHRLQPNPRSEFCVAQNSTKICEGLSVIKNMVFDVIKLLIDGTDLMRRRRGGKKRCDRNEL
jgi:hypothetical protein